MKCVYKSPDQYLINIDRRPLLSALSGPECVGSDNLLHGIHEFVRVERGGVDPLLNETLVTVGIGRAHMLEHLQMRQLTGQLQHALHSHHVHLNGQPGST